MSYWLLEAGFSLYLERVSRQGVFHPARFQPRATTRMHLLKIGFGLMSARFAKPRWVKGQRQFVLEGGSRTGFTSDKLCFQGWEPRRIRKYDADEYQWRGV